MQKGPTGSLFKVTKQRLTSGTCMVHELIPVKYNMKKLHPDIEKGSPALKGLLIFQTNG